MCKIFYLDAERQKRRPQPSALEQSLARSIEQERERHKLLDALRTPKSQLIKDIADEKGIPCYEITLGPEW